MLGRILTTLLIPLWIALILVIFSLALICRLLGYVRDFVEVIGDFLADGTKLAIESLAKL